MFSKNLTRGIVSDSLNNPEVRQLPELQTYVFHLNHVNSVIVSYLYTLKDRADMRRAALGEKSNIELGN